MTDLEYLKQQDNLHNKYMNEKFNNGEEYGWHIHMCDFEIIRKLLPKAHKKDWSKYKCKQYLKQFGKKRDECLECCDSCPHMRYISVNDENFILSITTMGIEETVDRCLVCNTGLMHKDETFVLTSLPPKYRYLCDHCGNEEYKLY